MNYIQLSRELDKHCKDTDTGYMPDDVLKLILGYTGHISNRPTYFYKLSVRYKYKNRKDKWERHFFEYPLYYCSCCNGKQKLFKSNNHIYTNRHRRNMKKNGDLGNEITNSDVYKYINGYYRYKLYIKDVEIYRMRDVWK